MKIVNTKLDGTLSLVDKTWNDAMETAALHCDDRAKWIGMNDEVYDDGRFGMAVKIIRNIAAELRETKR